MVFQVLVKLQIKVLRSLTLGANYSTQNHWHQQWCWDDAPEASKSVERVCEMSTFSSLSRKESCPTIFEFRTDFLMLLSTWDTDVQRTFASQSCVRKEG